MAYSEGPTVFVYPKTKMTSFFFEIFGNPSIRLSKKTKNNTLTNENNIP